MPFIPHHDNDTTAMLSDLGIDNLNELYREVPTSLPRANHQGLPEAVDEATLTRIMQSREPDNKHTQCFIGAGAYEHHIPAAVWDIVGRGEFYTAYTPYQAEASQGSLQVIFEFQHMLCALMETEVANASLYDGATAVAEAALMAIRLQRNKKTHLLVPENLHPAYRQVIHTLLSQQQIPVTFIPFTTEGTIDLDTLSSACSDAAAVIVPQPNFFGCIEAVDEITNLAHQHQCLVIGVVNPVAMAWVKPPGQWGENGADIVCGEGQPLGIPLSSGGPYFGFMCTRKKFIRQLPGRIVAKTVDTDGKPGYTLTLQAREQHIRRGKATSNICTNQGLMVVAATITMKLLGGQGLMNQAQQCYDKTHFLKTQLQQIPGIEVLFNGPHFHEFVLRFKQKRVKDILAELARSHIQGGYDLTQDYPQLGECLLICVTETKWREDLNAYIDALSPQQNSL